MIPESNTGGNRAYVYLISAVAALSGLLFGFDTAVINGALPFLRDEFRLNDFQVELVAGILLVGCIGGAGVAGYVSDRLGRRRALIVSAIVFALASIGSAIPRGLTDLALARLAAGVAIGLASVLGPMYIAEVAPPHIRGRLVTINQLAIVSGILMAYYVNWLLAAGGSGNWRWMFATAAVPSIAFWLGLLGIPESPRWLARKRDDGDALKVLERVVGPAEARLELKEIHASIAQESAFTLADLFRSGLRRPVMLAIVLAALSQVTGINTIIYYGSILLREHAGQSASSAIGANVLIGVINFGGTIVAMFTIDRIGRRALLLFGSAGMAVSLGALGLAFHSRSQPFSVILGLILAYVFCFAVSLGPGVWVYISEMFPNTVRGRAMSIGTMSVWIACLAVTLTFLTLVQALTTAGAFWFYGAICAVTFVFVYRALPETKGQTLEEIQEFWKK
ncbi:MAG: sugar porter family MFS transporter [Bryobacteraceae bacterium]